MARTIRVLMSVALAIGLATTCRAVEPDKLLPPDADTVVIVNLRQIIDAEIFKQNMLDNIKKELERDQAKQLLADLGLDPLKDIDRLVIGSVETQFKKGAQPKFLAVIHGKFDPQKLFKTAEARARNNGDKYSMVKDGDTIMFKYQENEEEPSLYATVVNEKTVIAASDKKLVTEALKAADANKPAQIKKELAALISKFDDKSSVVVASLMKDKLNELEIPRQGPLNLGGLQKALPGIETLAVVIRIGADVNIDVNLGMKDSDAAGDLRNSLDDLFRDFGNLISLAGDNPQAKAFGDVLSSFRVTSKNKFVTLTGKVSAENARVISTPRPPRSKDKDKDKEEKK